MSLPPARELQVRSWAEQEVSVQMWGRHSNKRALGQAGGQTGSCGPHCRSAWGLRLPRGPVHPVSTVSHQVPPLERRKYMLKSLDQIKTVNSGRVATRLSFPDREALAEHADLKSMVELIKRMLTWESHERISPSAALCHPFVSMQQLHSAHKTTHYYQLSLRGCHLSLQVEGKPPMPVVAAADDGPPYYCLAEEEEATGMGSVPFFHEKVPSMERAIDQLDGLSLEEASCGPWGETSTDIPNMLAPLKAAAAACRGPDAGPEPILAFYGRRLAGHKARKPPASSKSDSNFSNLIRLSQASPEDDGPCQGSSWAEGKRHGASAKLPTTPQQDRDGLDVKDMTMDAEVRFSWDQGGSMNGRLLVPSAGGFLADSLLFSSPTGARP